MQDNYGDECTETVADLRRELATMRAERDALLAWKEAVPVAEIETVYYAAAAIDGIYWQADRADALAIVHAWSVSLPQPEAQP